MRIAAALLALALALTAPAAAAGNPAINWDEPGQEPLAAADWQKRLRPNKIVSPPDCDGDPLNLYLTRVYDESGAIMPGMYHDAKTQMFSWKPEIGLVVWTGSRFKNRTPYPVRVATFCL